MSHWRDELRFRLASLELRPEREAEIVEELSQHLDDRVRELESGGASADQARRAALADLDTPGALAGKLAEIEARRPLVLPPPGQPARGRWLAALWLDTRHAIASLRRTPGFALTVAGALALTIGPITAILSVADWMIWRPPPGVMNPDRLGVVWFGEWVPDVPNAVSPRRVSSQNIDDLVAASTTTAALAGWQESSSGIAVPGGAPRQAGTAHATANFFDVLGVRPVAGRGFTADDDVPPFGARVAMVSHTLAVGAFGGADAAIGREVLVNGRALEVIGVLPEGFVGVSPFSRVDVWYPSWTYYYVNHFGEAGMARRTGRSGGVFYSFIARLAPGVDFDAMGAELDVLVPAIANQHPEDNAALATARARLFPGLGIQALQRQRYAELASTLMLIGGALLLLGCANVANMLISRGVKRQHERALRLALGASRRRLMQLLLAESIVLSVAGAALGVLLAYGLRGVIPFLLFPDALTAHDVPLDGRVLLVTLLLATACGVAGGLAPAWLGSAGRPSGGLARSEARVTGGRSRLRTGFAAVQLALSLALVTNALLLVGTVRTLAAVDVGFTTDGVTAHYLDLSSHGYPAAQLPGFNRDLLSRLSIQPAIEAVSLSSSHPFGPGYRAELVDALAGRPDATLLPYTNFVTPGYFDVLGIPMLRGRVFTLEEATALPGAGDRPVVLDEVLARRLFADANPVGQRVRWARPFSPNEPDEMVVIGVARHARWGDLTGEPDLLMYVPFTYGGNFAASRPAVLVRSRLSTVDAGELVQSTSSQIDATLPFGPPRALTAVKEAELADQRVLASVLSLLGSLGFVLAAFGLYGLLAQMVGERTREFGIRLAIGARRGHVFSLVLRQAGWIAGIGGMAGLLLAILGGRAIESELFGVTPLEPWVYAASLAALAAIVFVAATWPARTATRIEPVTALRME